jgi:hypothetical protein
MPRLVILSLPKYLSRPVMLSLLISCTLALISLTSYLNIQPVIPLLYSLARPSQYLVSKEWIFLFPIFSFLITVTHLLIVKMLSNLETVVLKIFIWVTITLQIFLSIAMIRIILLVT